MKRRHHDHTHEPTTTKRLAPGPGRRTRSESLPATGQSDPVQCSLVRESVAHEDPFAMHLLGDPVQMRGGDQDQAEHVHAAATHGIAGAGGALPFLNQIQASFGPEHDVSHVQAHVDGAAAEGSAAMGARAYATGNHVAFAGAPDLHTAAHEAAHVVQQRGGVQLKAGVGEVGDTYERHADAVADRVLAGESAADLLGGGTARPSAAELVQRQPVQAGSAAVDVTVDWQSPFGDDLSGTIILFGRSGTSGSWTRIDSKAVANAGSTTFSGATRYRYYKATVKPADDVEGDDQAVGKFKTTTDLTSGAVDASAPTATVGGRLELNRWNRDNVEQRHDREGIDAEQAGEDDIRSTPLFGRRVRVHRLVVPRVERTNALYEALPEDEKAEIGRSMFVAGGYAYRNQVGKAGAFSDHSVGMAIDVNYNEGKTQNALMETPAERELLNKVVEPVVKSDPAHAGFKIWEAQGQAQLEASHVFNEQFPRYLAELMQRDEDVAALDAADSAVSAAMTPGTLAAMPAAVLARFHTASVMLQAISKSDIEAAAAAQPDATKKRQLEIIASFWDSINAWVRGTTVTDKAHKDADGNTVPSENKTAVGMIPLDSRVLQMFLDTGWSWGGDWTGGTRKDYMHFEDESLMEQIRVDEEE